MSHEQPPMSEDPKLTPEEAEQISTDISEIVHSVEDLAPIKEGTEIFVVDPVTKKKVAWGVMLMEGTEGRPTMLRLMRTDLDSGMPETKDVTDPEEIKRIQKLNFWEQKREKRS